MSTFNPVKTAQRAKGFPSFGATAKALLAEHPENNWGMKPRSLETQLGKLDKGESTWWANRIEVAQALCALLDLSLPDLGLHGNAVPKVGFDFSEFPGLKPLDLKHEKPWKIGVPVSDEEPRDKKFGECTLDDWLNPTPTQWRAPCTQNWLCVPDALEMRLLTQHLAVTSPYRVVFTQTLEAASIQLQDVKPLILVVDNDVSEQDFKTLGLRHESAGLLVISPVPVCKAISEVESMMQAMSWERRSLSSEQRKQFDRAAPIPLKRWTWALQPNWRATLFQWVEKRLNRQEADTLFDAASVCSWLERFDPLGQWFETTSDVLQLCAVAHSQPSMKLPNQSDAEAGRKLAQLAFSDKVSQRSQQLQQWAVARWNRLEFRWRGSLPMADWLALLPVKQIPPSAEDVHAIALGRSSLERKRAAARVVDQLAAGNPDALQASELLKVGLTGQFDFAHPTLVRLIVRDMLIQQIAEEPVSSWGLTCFDAGRSMLVDAALDVIPIDTLMQAVRRLMLEDANTAAAAAALGASEAFFVAIGRRIANREVIHETYLPQLKVLAEAVVGRLELDLSTFSMLAPWSRPLDSTSHQLTWIATCWAWSLLVKVPDKLVADLTHDWQFVGWSDSLPSAPDWLNSLWPEEHTEQLSSAWKYFFKVADEWVKDLNHPMEDAPRILRLALLGRAAHGAWAADPAWWEDLVTYKTPWAMDALLDSFKAASKAAARNLWPSYLEFEMGANKRDSRLNWVHLSPVRIWLLAQLSPAECLDGLAPTALNHLASSPYTLPPEFRAPLLLARSQFISFQSFADTGPFVARFGHSALPALPVLLAHEWLGGAAAEHLWVWDAGTAERLLIDKSVDWIARHHLLHACPPSKIAFAAAALVENQAWFPLGDCCSWARGHLPTAGKNAQVLLEIIRSCPRDEGGLGSGGQA